MSWTMRKRRRIKYDVITPSVAFDSKTYINGVLNQVDLIESDRLMPRLTIEECHDVDRKVHPRTKDSLDDGGPFYLKKLELLSPGVSWSASADSGSTYDPYYYETSANATAVASNPRLDPLFTMDLYSIENEWDFSVPPKPLVEYGPEAMRRLDPTRIKGIPTLARSIAELAREGIPRNPAKILSDLVNAKKMAGKRTGSDYLAVNFGWKPLLSDLIAIVQTYQNIRPLVAQLLRDEGQSVRRSGTLDKIRERTEPTETFFNITPKIGTGTAGAFPNTSDGYGRVMTWTETREDVWFAGKGNYVLPETFDQPSDSDIENFLSIQKALLSPAIVYDLIPWTWLVNWFTNLGDIVANAYGSGVGTYTAQYCYLMRRRKVTEYFVGTDLPTYEFQTFRAIPVTKIRNVTATVTKTTLERIAATPYGFGLTLDELSPSQWAILTALGLSRQNFI